MKQNWEYKKLGEVGSVITGSTPPTKEEKNYESNDVCFIKPSDFLENGINYLSNSEYFISNFAYANSRQLPKGAVLTTCIGNIGKVAILEVDATCNQQINAIIPNVETNSKFLAYSIISQRFLLQSMANAPVVPLLNKTQFSNIPIPVPPLSTQTAIVSELDALSAIIADHKSLLKKYDELEQSIFYDMFGDPVKNDKGWVVKKLGEIGSLGRGVSKHRPRNAPELLGGTMPLIQTGDVANADFYIKNYNSTYSELGVAQSKVWKKGTLCITIAATIGKCAFLNFDACFPDSVVGFVSKEEYVEKVFVFYIFRNLQKILEEEAPCVAQKNINLMILENLDIPLPPLPLQQEFASKIEAIEAMKADTKKSLAKSEELFNARMDYYFNA